MEMTSTEVGGALYWAGSNATLNNCNFTNGSSNGNSGGAIYFWRSYNSLTNCVFDRCSCYLSAGDSGFGGAIYFSGKYNSLTNCVFNKCNFTGGKIIGGIALFFGDDYNYMYNCAINGCNINNTNLSLLFGSVLFLDDFNFIVDCRVNNCSINAKNGEALGMIAFEGHVNYLENCVFDDCNIYSRYSNASVVAENDVIYLNNCSFHNCEGGYAGLNLIINVSSEYIITFNLNMTPIVNGNGTVTVVGDGYNKTFTFDMAVTNNVVIDNLTLGNYTISGISDDNTTVLNGTFRVSLAPTPAPDDYLLNASDVVKDFQNATQYNVRVTDKYGNPIYGVNVTVSIDCEWFKNLTYTITSNSNGIATLRIDLYAGKYTIKATSGNCTIANNITVLPVEYAIESWDVLKYFENGTHYHVKVMAADDGRTLKYVTVKVVINCKYYKGLTYYITSDGDGIATLPIFLNPGEYSITAYLDDKTAENKITVLQPLYNLEASDVFKYYRNGTQYSVTVTDNNGDAVVGKTVVLTVNSDKWAKPVNYYVNTDENGTATLRIDLYAGVYTISASMAGNTKLNNIVVIPTLTASDLIKNVNEPANLTAKLVNGTGAPAVNKTVTFSLPSKTYTTTTNEEGIASLPIGLNPGTWQFTIANPETGARTIAKVVVTA